MTKKSKEKEIVNNSKDESSAKTTSSDGGGVNGIASDRILFLVVIIITWVFVIGGMSYIYKEVQSLPRAENNSEVIIDKIYTRIARIEEIQKVKKKQPDVIQTLEFNRKTVNRLEKLERIVDSLPREFPEPVKIPDNLVDQGELLTILTRVQKLEEDFSKRDGSSKAEEYINPLLMSIMNLREHLIKGLPYEADITLLNAIGGNDEKIKGYLKKLEKILNEKISSIDDLKDSFDKTAKTIYQSSIGGDESVWEKTKSLLANAITIRQVSDDMEGSSVEAILARAEIYLKSGNISRVVKELKQLKGKSAKIAKEWLDNAKKYRDIEKVFSDIYSRTTEISADIFKIENAKSPIPEAKPIEDNVVIDRGNREKNNYLGQEMDQTIEQIENSNDANINNLEE